MSPEEKEDERRREGKKGLMIRDQEEEKGLVSGREKRAGEVWNEEDENPQHRNDGDDGKEGSGNDKGEGEGEMGNVPAPTFATGPGGTIVSPDQVTTGGSSSPLLKKGLGKLAMAILAVVALMSIV